MKKNINYKALKAFVKESYRVHYKRPYLFIHCFPFIYNTKKIVITSKVLKEQKFTREQVYKIMIMLIRGNNEIQKSWTDAVLPNFK